MENLEIEYKVLVKKKYLDILKMYFRFEGYERKSFNQINTYFDTKDFKLRVLHLSLRIRHIIKNNTYILTLKEPQKEGRLEHEYDVKGNSIENINQEVIDILDKYNIDIKDIEEVAKLQTKRYEYNFEGCTICLDYNSYYGKKDYEIECEAASSKQAIDTLTHLLKKFNIPYQETRYPKIVRAIQNRIIK